MANRGRKNKYERYAPYRSIVCDILDIEDSNDWAIFDKDGDYVLVHYLEKPSTDYQKYGRLRGIIVDIETHEVVRETFSFMPERVVESIVANPDGSITVPKSNHDYLYNTMAPDVFPEGQFSLQNGHDGVAVDIWKDKNGKVRISSLKKIDIRNTASQWDNSLPFNEIFKELRLPNPEVMFNRKYKSSSKVHSFIMSHPHLFGSSKELIGAGYAIYLGYKDMPRNDSEGLEPEAVELSQVVDNTTAKCAEAQSRPGLIYLPPATISVNKANIHLRYGYYTPWNDEKVPPCLRSGEFIVLTDKRDGQMYRILSPAHDWRLNMRFRPHLHYVFFVHAHAANKRHAKRWVDSVRQKENDFFKDGFFPHLTRENLDEMRNLVELGKPIIRLVGKEKLNLSNYNDRLLNIWLCLLLAVPIHKQREVMGFIDYYKNRLREGADAVMSIVREPEVYSPETVGIALRLSHSNRFYTKNRDRSSSSSNINSIMGILQRTPPLKSYRYIRDLTSEVQRALRNANKQ